VTFVKDGHGHRLKDDGEAVTLFGGNDERWGEVVKFNGLRRQVVGLSVELFGRHTDESFIDPVVTEVAGDFLDSE